MYIDNETGEVIEDVLPAVKEEMSAIITDDVLEKFEQMQIIAHQLEKWEQDNKAQIMEVMKRYGIKSFKNDYVNITYKAPYERKTLDKDALALIGGIDLTDENYYKKTEVKESLSIKLKEAE